MDNTKPAAPQPPVVAPGPTHQSGRNVNPSKKLFLIAGLVLLLIAVPVVVMLSQTEQDLRQEASSKKNKGKGNQGKNNQRKAKGREKAAGKTNQNPGVTESTDDIDAVLMLLDQEEKEESVTDQDENTSETEYTAILQDVEVLSNTDPDDE